mmetsp:Transcript_1098/g.3390  ORF Transcript_1098/g.3390 Transcript_1098/m.3390 type:complete len:235 (-) Transcript_1098:2621-3325(-)
MPVLTTHIQYMGAWCSGRRGVVHQRCLAAQGHQSASSSSASTRRWYCRSMKTSQSLVSRKCTARPAAFWHPSPSQAVILRMLTSASTTCTPSLLRMRSGSAKQPCTSGTTMSCISLNSSAKVIVSSPSSTMLQRGGQADAHRAAGVVPRDGWHEGSQFRARPTSGTLPRALWSSGSIPLGCAPHALAPQPRPPPSPHLRLVARAQSAREMGGASHARCAGRVGGTGAHRLSCSS